MFTKSMFFLLLVCCFMTSCNKEAILLEDNTTVDNSAIDNSTFKGVDSKTLATTVILQENPDGPPMGPYTDIPGTSSKLHRTANGITVNVKTKNLTPGNAYTMWWVVFGETPGPPTVTYAAGHVANGNGKGNFSSHQSVGETFNNPLTAEVHLTIRSHGPVQPEMMPDQIQTINGGCLPEIGFPSGPALYPDSDVVGYCANMQVAIHPGN